MGNRPAFYLLPTPDTMASADNLALSTLLYPAVSVIRDTATVALVEAEEAADTVWRLSGSYQIEADLDADAALIDIMIGSTLPTTNGVRVTLPREGGTVLAAAAGTTNAVANLLFWETGTSEWKNFVVNVTLKDTAGTAGWDLVVKPHRLDAALDTAIVGEITPIIFRQLTWTRTS